MLRFCNNFTQDLWIAYMFHSPDQCRGDGGNWQAIGWYHVVPGACTVPYANSLHDVGNRFWYFFAENFDSSVVWAGPIAFNAPNNAFNTCFLTQTNINVRRIGFRVFDVGDSSDFTVNLHL